MSVSVTNVWPSAVELALQLEVVLDDAVVDDDDPAVAVAVRMRVLLGRPAVRRPARVADAELALDRILRQHVVQVARACRRCGGSCISPSRTTATPAESYPRYSSRRRPSISTGSSGLDPTYPTIPHMVQDSPFDVLRARRLAAQPGLFSWRRARDAERVGRHVLGDRRSRGDVRARADASPAR